MVMLAAGDLRELVIVEVPVETRNDLGESIQTWHHFARRRASIEALSYTEQQRRQQVGGSVSYMVRIRYLDGLTGIMRLRWATRGDRILYVSSVVERNNREEHELMCEEQAT